MKTIQRTYKRHNRNVKLFIDKARGDLIQDIDETKSLILQAIKVAIKANMRPESMDADKVRAKLDSFRDTLKQTDPILNVYRKAEKKVLDEKKRFKSVVLFIELLLIEFKYLKDLATALVWTARNRGSKGRDQFKEIVNDMHDKLAAYEQTIGMYEGFITTSLGREKLDDLKKQLLEFFNKKELNDIVRLVRRLKLRKLEQRYLAGDDLLLPGVDPDWMANFDQLVADESAEPPEDEPADVVDHESEDLLLHLGEVEPLPEEPEPLHGEEPEGEAPDLAAEPESSEAEATEEQAAEDDANTDDIEGTPNVSHLEAFVRAVTGKSVYDDQIRTFIIEKGQEIKDSGNNSVPLAKLYEEIMTVHPDWKITPKQFLHAAKDLAKYGVISALERLDTGYYMVQFLPVELTEDPASVLALSKDHSCISKKEIMDALSWPEHRVDESLDFLQDKGFIKTDTSYMDGTKYFFVGSTAAS